MSDVDLDRLEALAAGARRRGRTAGVSPTDLAALIARLREAEDAMNVCARCGHAVDAEVAAEEATTAAEGFDPSATTDTKS